MEWNANTAVEEEIPSNFTLLKAQKLYQQNALKVSKVKVLAMQDAPSQTIIIMYTL